MHFERSSFFRIFLLLVKQIHFFENKGTLSFEELFDCMLLPFENRYYYGSKEYDLCLKRLYGNNYMELPPKDKQITHKPIKVIFEDD